MHICLMLSVELQKDFTNVQNDKGYVQGYETVEHYKVAVTFDPLKLQKPTIS